MVIKVKFFMGLLFMLISSFCLAKQNSIDETSLDLMKNVGKSLLFIDEKESDLRTNVVYIVKKEYQYSSLKDENKRPFDYDRKENLNIWTIPLLHNDNFDESVIMSFSIHTLLSEGKKTKIVFNFDSRDFDSSRAEFVRNVLSNISNFFNLNLNDLINNLSIIIPYDTYMGKFPVPERSDIYASNVNKILDKITSKEILCFNSFDSFLNTLQNGNVFGQYKISHTSDSLFFTNFSHLEGLKRMISKRNYRDYYFSQIDGNMNIETEEMHRFVREAEKINIFSAFSKEKFHRNNPQFGFSTPDLRSQDNGHLFLRLEDSFSFGFFPCDLYWRFIPIPWIYRTDIKIKNDSGRTIKFTSRTYLAPELSSINIIKSDTDKLLMNGDMFEFQIGLNLLNIFNSSEDSRIGHIDIINDGNKEFNLARLRFGMDVVKNKPIASISCSELMIEVEAYKKNCWINSITFRFLSDVETNRNYLYKGKC